MDNKTVYLGNAQKKNENWFKGYLKINELKKAIEVQERYGSNFLNININIRDQVDQYGNQMSISLDTWKPDIKNNNPF